MNFYEQYMFFIEETEREWIVESNKIASFVINASPYLYTRLETIKLHYMSLPHTDLRLLESAVMGAQS